MKLRYFASLLLLSNLLPAQGHSILLKIKGLKDTVCYFGNYYGDKQYVKDTSRIDKNGNVTFAGKNTLDGGIYLVVIPSKKFFELIIDKEQKFSVETDTADFTRSMKIKGSQENDAFYKYLNFATDRYRSIDPIRKLLDKTRRKDSIEMLSKRIESLDKEVIGYKLQYIKDHPDFFSSKVFKASADPEVPKEYPKLPNGKVDSAFGFRYYKQHFFDNIDFSDDRLLRTPIFHNKIKQYLDRLTMQVPDSLNAAADFLAEKARANSELFKYVVYYITYTYETSSIMGFDAVFVHMVEKYYSTHQAAWVDSAHLAKIVDKARTLSNLLIGKKMNNISLTDTKGEAFSLYSVKADYTIVYFWEPGCGHCQKITPKLKEFYDKRKKEYGLEVYAVDISSNKEEWNKFIAEHGLDWVNVMDPYNYTDYKKQYDVYATPVVYVLDENKTIIAKRLGVENLDEFIKNFIKTRKGGK